MDRIREVLDAVWWRPKEGFVEVDQVGEDVVPYEHGALISQTTAKASEVDCGLLFVNPDSLAAAETHPGKRVGKL